MVTVAIDPRGRDLTDLLTDDDGGPVVMVNLLRFAVGGRDVYQEYARRTGVILAKYGAEVVYAGDGSTVLVAEPGQSWDAVLLVRYPTRAAFSRLMADPEYQQVARLRSGALVEAVLQATIPWATPASAAQVRPALAHDAPALARVHVAAWRAAYVGVMPQHFLDGLDVATRQAAWVGRLDSPPPGTRALAAIVGEHAVGFALVGAAQDEQTGDDGQVYALNVHPGHWRTGIGTALLLAAQDALLQLGHRHATLWVATANQRARAFYERHGWVADGHARGEEISAFTVDVVRYGRRLTPS